MTGDTLRKSSSTGTINVAPARGPRPQVSSTLVGSAAYSFGKPRHRKGTFKIPVLDARSPEYVPGRTDAPGAGAYNIHGTIARHDTKYGHPQCKKAPGFMWSRKTEPRDVIHPQSATGSDPATVHQRYTHLSHCRSDSFLDVPGPGSYDIIHTEGLRHNISGKTQGNAPSYTLRRRCDPIENNPRKPPGPGPFEYETRHRQVVLNNRQPTHIIPKMKRVSEALLPLGGTPDDIAPGKYDHPIALMSKYPGEEVRHRKQHT